MSLAPSYELLLLLFARMTGVAFTAPPFNDAALPNLVRVALALALTAAVFPAARGLPAVLSLPDLLVHALLELGLGILIGVVAQGFLSAALTMGGLLDASSGLSLASVLNPVLGETTSLYAGFAASFAIFVFAVGGGFDTFVTALAVAEQVAPVGIVPRVGSAILPYVLDATGGAFVVGVLLAFPVLVALVVVNVAIGLMARVLPQMNLFVFSLAVGPLVSLVLTALVLGTFAQVLNRYALSLLDALPALLHAVAQ